MLESLHTGVVDETRATGGPLTEGIAEAVEEILAWRAALRKRVLRHADERGSEFSRSEVAFDLAREFCALYAAAACFWMWAHNRDVPNVAARADVTLLSLQRLLRRHGRQVPPRDPTADVLDRLLEMHREGRLFSAFCIPLGTRER